MVALQVDLHGDGTWRVATGVTTDKWITQTAGGKAWAGIRSGDKVLGRRLKRKDLDELSEMGLQITTP